MGRMIAIVISILLGSTVHAYPAVGDYVLLASDDGYTKEAQVLSYDQTTKLYHARYTEKFLGKVLDIEDRHYGYYDVYNSQWVETLLSQCNDVGGQFENIKLPVGNFETCLFRDWDSGEVINAGRPPFGVVQGDLRTSDGSAREFKLQKYQFGI